MANEPLWEAARVTPGHLDPPGHEEPISKYLATSDRPLLAAMRQMLETWYELVPSGSRPDIRGRLHDRDDRQFYSAFWELYLAATFHALDFGVEWHPDLPGTTRRTDFLLRVDDMPWGYVEARVVNVSEADLKAGARLARVRSTMARWIHPRWLLGLGSLAIGQAPLNSRSLKRDLFAWLDGLSATGSLNERLFEWRQDGWHLSIAAIPRRPLNEGEEPTGALVMYDQGPGGLIDNVSPLLTALETKGSAYGNFELPFLLAVLANPIHTTGLDDVAHVLFGPVERSGDYVLQPMTDEQHFKRAFWRTSIGPRYTRVSAAMVARGLHPWNANEYLPEVWTNGWAKNPLHPGLPHGVFRHEDNDVRFSQATTTIAAMLNLPPTWPVDPDENEG